MEGDRYLASTDSRDRLVIILQNYYYLSWYGLKYLWTMLTLFGLHLQMTSMRSVSPWGLHVQSLSVHNSPSSCDIDGDMNKKHNTKYMQIFVLESFTQCLKRHVSIMFNENHFILNYKVSVSLTLDKLGTISHLIC